MKEAKKEISDLMRLLYSHPHGWAPISAIEKEILSMGFSIEPLERDNHTDGGYHKRFTKDGDFFDLDGNYYDVKTISPLITWIENYMSCEES